MLVGRSRELELVHAGLRTRGRVAIVGAAGIGKTALARAAASETGAPVFAGGGLAALGWHAYLPLTRAFGRPPPPGDRARAAAWAAAETGAGILFLDDLHWMDADTLAALALLPPSTRVLASVRAGDPGERAAREALGAARFELLELRGLSASDAATLVRHRHPEAREDEVARVVALADGNPLALEELSAAGEPSPTLEASLRVRLERCEPSAREAMALLGLLGRPAGERLLGTGAEELVAAGLAVRTPDGVAPRHALLGEAAATGLSAASKRGLHARLAAALDDPGEAARHHRAAGDLEAAVRMALAAAEAATRPAERAEHLALAAECAGDAGADDLRLRAAAALVDARQCERARRLAEAVRARDPLRQAGVALQLGRAAWALGESAASTAHLERGRSLARGTRTPVEVELLVESAMTAVWAGRDASSVALAREAVSLARETGHGVARAGRALGAALYLSAATESCIPYMRGALRAAVAAGDHDLEAEAALNFAGALQAFGRSDEAYEVAARAEERMRELGLLGRELEVRWLRGRLTYMSRGAYEEAIELLGASLAEPALAHPHGAHVAADLTVALADVGRFDEARAVHRDARERAESPWDRGVVAHAQAELAWCAGRPERALSAAEEMLEIGLLRHLTPFAAALRDWALLDLERAPGEPVKRSPARLVDGASDESEGLTRLAAGDHAEAVRLLDRAARTWRGNVLRGELRARWGAAEVLRRGGDVGAARERLLELEQRAERHGMEPLLGRIRRSLRQCGERRSAPRAAAGVLTPRELEVLRHVGRGATSREIAAKLGVTRATVDTTVDSAMAKLRARTRAQAAALASRLG